MKVGQLIKLYDDVNFRVHGGVQHLLGQVVTVSDVLSSGFKVKEDKLDLIWDDSVVEKIVTSKSAVITGYMEKAIGKVQNIEE